MTLGKSKKVLKYYSVTQSPFYKLERKKDLFKLLFLTEKQVDLLLKYATDGTGRNFTVSSVESKGKNREVHIPKDLTHKVHNRIFLLLRRIKSPDYLHSGVKKRSHVTNALTHSGSNLNQFSIDISKFYNSTSYKMIFHFFQDVMKCSKDVSYIIANIISFNGHLPTGSPVSQVVSFLVNMRMFDKLNRLAKHNNICMTVYVDDITFSGDKIPSEFVSSVKSIIDKKGYKTHKISLCKSADDDNSVREVTGVIIKSDGSVDVPNRIRHEIYSLKRSIDFEKSLAVDIALQKYKKIIGLIYSAAQISPGYKTLGKKYVDMQREYVNTLADEAISSSK